MPSSKIELITDQSNQQLQEVPENVLTMCNLRMLYLEKNSIEYLPEDFFNRLPKLTWLDLRHNRLKCIPKSIASSECLENLLLNNNQVERLPTELGLVPTLKNLLISGNPLTYPSEYILDKGTEAICEYLRMEHLKIHPIERSKSAEMQAIKPEKSPAKRPKSANVRQLLRAASKSAMAKPPSDTPVITITSLSPQKEDETMRAGDQKAIVPTRRHHKITKCCSKLTVRSNLNNLKYLAGQKSIKTHSEIEDAEMKEMWLKKLKGLLDEQNKILQQEKNLKALSSWRFNKKMEPTPRTAAIRRKRVKAPYGTDPAYDIMMSRQQLSEQIDRVIKDTKKPTKNKAANIEKLIAEVVTQLKSLEGSCMEMQSPRTEIENAGKQIQTILELHKKITNAKMINDIS